MKKFFPYILIFVLITGLFVPTNAHAYTIWQMGECFAAIGECAWDATANVITQVLYLILTLVSFLLYIAGTLLDYVLKFTILDLRENLDLLPGINIAWKTIKDLMNIAFIFILIYEGIKLIIGMGSMDNVKKFIAYVVVASILVNFSLFFTKVLIDASNVVSIGFYNSMTKESVPVIGIPGVGTVNIGGISVPFMKNLGLVNFWKGQTFDSMSASAGGNFNAILVPIMGIILFLIVSFSFFAIAIVFTIRYITLIILLMLSPVAYMGSALPSMSGYAKQWWESLLGQLIFAPLYMIMTYIILQLMGPGGLEINGNWGDLVKGASSATSATSNSSISLIFNFIIIIGLIIATLVISKSTAKRGSGYIGQMTGNLSTFAGNRVFGGASKLGRNTIGRAGSAIADSDYLKDRAVNGGIITSNLAKFTMKRGDKTANSSFDVRSTSPFASLAKSTDLNFGKGADRKKVNFIKDRDAVATAEADFAKKLKPSDDATEREKLKTQVPLDEIRNEAAKKTKEATDERQELIDKKAELEKKKATADQFNSTAESQKLKDEINSIENQIKAKETEIKTLEEISQKSIKASKDNEERIKNIYSTRAAAYAESFSGENSMWTWSKNILKAGTVGAIGGYALGSTAAGAGIGGTSFVTQMRTPADNRAIARKILKETKAKSEDEQLADLLKKKYEQEQKDKKAKEKEEGGGDEDDKEDEKKEGGDKKEGEEAK